LELQSREQKKITNYRQYYLDVDAANSNLTKIPKFVYEYSPLNAITDNYPGYGLQDMSFDSWNNLDKEITKNPNGTLAQLVEKYMYVSHGKIGEIQRAKKYLEKENYEINRPSDCGYWK